jgi:hypothetical protein
MAVRKVSYFYVSVPHRPGQGAHMLKALKKAGVKLVAFSGFPERGGAQLDFVPASSAAFRRVARKEGWKVKGPKRGFLIRGADRTGAVADILAKLASAKINVTAVDAVAAGGGRYGAILWVKPASYNRAARLLKAS